MAGGPAHSKLLGSLEWERDTRGSWEAGLLEAQALMKSVGGRGRDSVMVPGVSGFLIPSGVHGEGAEEKPGDS